MTSVGEAHSRARRVLGKFFVKSRLDTMAVTMAVEVDRFADLIFEPELQRSSARSPTSEEETKQPAEDSDSASAEIDMQEFFGLVTLQLFCKLQLSFDVFAFGTAPGTVGWDASRVRTAGEIARTCCDAISYGSNVIGEHMLYNIPLTRALPRVRRVEADIKTFRSELLDPLIAHRKAELSADRVRTREEEAPAVPEDCLTALLGADYSEPEIRDQLVTLIGAGHDTTSFFSCYAALMLAKHPDVQEAVRRELCSATFDSDFCWATSLLKRVVQETLRLYPVIPMVTRVTAHATSLPDGRGGRLELPAKTRVLVPFFLINRLPEIYGDDAARFDPDRWLESNQATKSDGITNSKQGFLPFGHGSRTCVGYSLALIEMRVIFQRILARYDLHEIPGFAPTIKAGVSLTVVNPKGIKVRIVRRTTQQR